jgi:hypothetical protein
MQQFMDTVGRERVPEINTDGLVGPCKVQGRDGKVGERKMRIRRQVEYIPLVIMVVVCLDRKYADRVI